MASQRACEMRLKALEMAWELWAYLKAMESLPYYRKDPLPRYVRDLARDVIVDLEPEPRYDPSRGADPLEGDAMEFSDSQLPAALERVRHLRRRYTGSARS